MAGKKAVAYMRYSSNNQRETSIEYQRARILLYSAANDITIVHEYIDRANTATHDNRYDFQLMVKDAQSNPDWDTILVYDRSRFVRNYLDGRLYNELFEDYGIKVISVTEDFGTSNEAFLAVSITDVFNDYFSRDNAKKTHAGMVMKSQKAEHCGGIPPLGYDIDANGQLIINPIEANTVQRIFDMFELNYSYTKMAEILNSEGKKNKRGGSFGKHSFNSLLQQEKYTGTYIWNKTKAKNSKHKHNSHAHKPLEAQTRIEGGCPQIISPEQFQRVQQKMAERACGRAASKNRRHYMLTGLEIVRCAECGAYMTGVPRSSRNGNYTTYTCPNHRSGACPTKEIRTEYVDTMVAGMLSRDLYNRTDLSELTEAIRNNNDTCKMLMLRKRQIKKATQNILYRLETDTSELLFDKLRALEHEKQSVDRQLAAAQTEIASLDKINIRPICNELGRMLKTSDAPEVKAYLAHAIKEVLISNEEVKITLNIA